jgi:collagenase-like PrtC family protease
MLEHPVEILKMPWIRPENIKEYIRAGIDWFKISGREFKNIADFIKVVEIYNEGSFDGNLMELLHCFAESNFSQVFDIPNKNLDKFARRFFEETSTCTTKDCDTCNYCNINSSLVRVHTSNPWYKHFKEAYQKDLSALVKK